MYGIIYKATNLQNNKVYIGQTKNSIKIRQYDHFGKANNPTTKFHRAINKYGQNAFRWEIIDEAESKEELNNKEIFWIKKLKTYNDGYNSTIGGESTTGYHLTIETKQKISKSNIDFNKNRGKTQHPTWKHCDDKKLLELYNECTEWKQIKENFNLETRAIVRHISELLKISEQDVKIRMKRKKLIHDYNLLVKKANGLNYKLITTLEEYLKGEPYPSKMYLKIKCNNNHIFKMRASAFNIQNYKCPICSKSSPQYLNFVQTQKSLKNL